MHLTKPTLLLFPLLALPICIHATPVSNTDPPSSPDPQTLTSRAAGDWGVVLWGNPGCRGPIVGRYSGHGNSGCRRTSSTAASARFYFHRVKKRSGLDGEVLNGTASAIDVRDAEADVYVEEIVSDVGELCDEVSERDGVGAAGALVEGMVLEERALVAKSASEYGAYGAFQFPNCKAAVKGNTACLSGTINSFQFVFIS